MTLTLNRHPPGLTCTIGDLLVGGEMFCHTLEDPVREVSGKPVKAWKVAGDTAIPAGTYEVLLTYSPRFKMDLPLLVDVPGFAGIRIHAGNTSENTEGCILVGHWKGEEFITKSRDCLNALIDRIEDEKVTIEVCNPEAP